jgi:hypothetical protein
MAYFGRPAARGSIIALVACVALIVAHNSPRGIADEDAWAMDETTGSSPRDKHAPVELALSDEQRGRIYDGVMGIADAPVAPAPTVADALPAGVPMQDLPAAVTSDIPLVQGHKFVKFDDRIVVVDPASRLVVAMIPRYKLLPNFSSTCPSWRPHPEERACCGGCTNSDMCARVSKGEDAAPTCFETPRQRALKICVRGRRRGSSA